MLLAPRMSGGDEPDRAWGNQDDPAGSEFLRPSLALLTTTLTPTAELLAAPPGLLFDAATLPRPTPATTRIRPPAGPIFSVRHQASRPMPGSVCPFADRPARRTRWPLGRAERPARPRWSHAGSAASGFSECHSRIPCWSMTALLRPLPAEHAPSPRPRRCPIRRWGRSGRFPGRAAEPGAALRITGGRIALLDLPPGLSAGEDRLAPRPGVRRAALFAPWLRAARSTSPREPSHAALGRRCGADSPGRQLIGVYASPAQPGVIDVFAMAAHPGPARSRLPAYRADRRDPTRPRGASS